jgi:hypothetical protein
MATAISGHSHRLERTLLPCRMYAISTLKLTTTEVIGLLANVEVYVQ